MWCLWTLLGYTVAKAQEIRLGSPDRFSSWEGGVWGQDYLYKSSVRKYWMVWKPTYFNLRDKAELQVTKINKSARTKEVGYSLAFESLIYKPSDQELGKETIKHNSEIYRRFSWGVASLPEGKSAG